MSGQPIGLFDSGVGGLTVVRELTEILPQENIVYLGDTARLPYGNKSPATILRFAQENAAFLLRQNIKLLIVACHTACTHALVALQKELPIPVLGVTIPGIRALSLASKTGSVAILGTSSTINSGALQSLLHKENPGLTIHSIACPLFVPLVEEGLLDHPATYSLAEHYLASLRATPVDAVLLACTHYPLLAPLIQQVLGPHVQLILPARASAFEAKSFLTTNNLLNPNSSPPSHQFYSSDDPEKFRHLAKLFSPGKVNEIILVR